MEMLACFLWAGWRPKRKGLRWGAWIHVWTLQWASWRMWKDRREVLRVLPESYLSTWDTHTHREIILTPDRRYMDNQIWGAEQSENHRGWEIKVTWESEWEWGVRTQGAKSLQPVLSPASGGESGARSGANRWQIRWIKAWNRKKWGECWEEHKVAKVSVFKEYWISLFIYSTI